MSDIYEENIITSLTEAKKRGRPKKPIEIKPEETPKKLGRPIVPWRHGENGKYHSHSADPTYSTRYWQEHYRKPYAIFVVRFCNVVVVEFININVVCIVN